MDGVTSEMVDLLRASVVRQSTLAYESSGPLLPVAGDATQVRQIVLNLIVNATDAVETKGGAPGMVTVRTAMDVLPHADLSPPPAPNALSPGRYVRLEVADTGIGMSADTQARMFDPFYSTKASGRGLGLASVQGIVRSHHGALAVHSVPHEGTTIRVWLPVA
jgi:signal transduction histidine kinase